MISKKQKKEYTNHHLLIHLALSTENKRQMIFQVVILFHCVTLFFFLNIGFAAIKILSWNPSSIYPNGLYQLKNRRSDSKTNYQGFPCGRDGKVEREKRDLLLSAKNA